MAMINNQMVNLVGGTDIKERGTLVDDKLRYRWKKCWWFQPLWKQKETWVRHFGSWNSRWTNKTCSKPPTSFSNIYLKSICVVLWTSMKMFLFQPIHVPKIMNTSKANEFVWKWTIPQSSCADPIVKQTRSPCSLIRLTKSQIDFTISTY